MSSSVKVPSPDDLGGSVPIHLALGPDGSGSETADVERYLDNIQKGVGGDASVRAGRAPGWLVDWLIG